MHNYLKELVVVILVVFISQNATAQQTDSGVSGLPTKTAKKKTKKRNKSAKQPKIDLSHWKVTLPISNDKGKPIEIEAPEIFNFEHIEIAKPYMYVDPKQGAIVFHAMPTQSTTRNTKYSRSELREPMIPGDNNANWTFSDGGYLKAKIAMEASSKAANGKYHRTIILQIHGRLTNEQKELIGQDDNNAPPILKIYWDRGRIRIKTKVVKDLTDSEEELLHTDAWGDDDGITLPVDVGHDPFTLEVIVTNGRMEVILNDEHSVVYDSVHIQKWGIFENYFKAGNYLQSIDQGAYSYVKYFDLEVRHN